MVNVGESLRGERAPTVGLFYSATYQKKKKGFAPTLFPSYSKMSVFEGISVVVLLNLRAYSNTKHVTVGMHSSSDSLSFNQEHMESFQVPLLIFT